MEKHKHKYHKCHQITEWFVLERSFKDHLVQTLNVFSPMFSALIQELQSGIEGKEGEGSFLDEDLIRKTWKSLMWEAVPVGTVESKAETVKSD